MRNYRRALSYTLSFHFQSNSGKQRPYLPQEGFAGVGGGVASLKKRRTGTDFAIVEIGVLAQEGRGLRRRVSLATEAGVQAGASALRQELTLKSKVTDSRMLN